MPSPPPSPCPECGAPPAAPFERNPTMRRARHTARLILLLAIITPLLAASILWPTTTRTTLPSFPSTSESHRTISFDAIQAIALGSRPASDLLTSIRHFEFQSGLCTDITKLFIFRQRQKDGDEYMQSFGVPMPSAELIRRVVPDAQISSRAPIVRRSFVGFPIGSQWLFIRFGAASFVVCLCIIFYGVLRLLSPGRWSLATATVLFLMLLLWPHRSHRPLHFSSMSVIPSWAVGALLDKQGFPYPHTDAEARAIAAEVVKYTDRVGTTSMDGDFDIVAEISGSRPIRTFHGIPFPILQHTTLTAATPFPPHRTAARLSWHTFDLQLPNTATATTRHILSLDIPALAQLIVLLLITYHIIRLIHYHILKRRHHKRLNQNLCPLCAYPAPKPA